MRLMISLLLAATALAGAASAKPRDAVAELNKLTPEYFQQSVKLQDDDLETTAVYSTEPGWQEKQGLLKMVNFDTFLRAVIDKKTGQTIYQVYFWTMYSGDWRHYSQANYETAEGPASTPVTKLGSDVISCAGSRYGGCLLREDVAFIVPEALLRQVAAKYQPDVLASGVWRFKLKARNGTDWADGLPVAEVAGLLMAVDAYRLRHKLPIAPSPASPAI